MAWEPPMTVEERLKALFVPGRWQVKYHLAREKLSGERELSLIPFLSDPRRISLDVGANKGVWAEAMRHHACAVHAFEPNPKIFRVLKAGMGPGVTPHHLALSDSTGLAELKVPRGRRGYSNQGASLSSEKIGHTAHGVVQVETRRLDDMPLGDIGFIKIDVEGFELAVIDGARKTLDKYRPNLIVEIEEKHAKRPIGELLAAVCAHGYEAFALDRGVLRRVAQIDLAARHSSSAPAKDYIFNWIFMPI